MKKSFSYFLIILLLIYNHTILLETDPSAWVINNFWISGGIIVYCISKVVQALLKTDNKPEVKTC